MTLRVRPSTRDEANAFIAANHRHHGRVVGLRFALAALDGDRVCGVVVVGRPVARALDPTTTAEVTRLCTDGTRNACSLLYQAARRAWQAMGGVKVVTYTLASEGGASLRAAGWRAVADVPGRSWSCASRPRTDKHPTTAKRRWESA